MPRNPVTALAESYIESQRKQGKSPSGAFFQYVPGATDAINNLAKKDREYRGLPDPNAKAAPAPKQSVGDILANRKAATDAMSAPQPGAAKPPSYKKGGSVRKTGLAEVHKGEHVLTKAEAKRFKHLHKSLGKMMRKKAG